MIIVTSLRLLLISIWLGAALFFSAVVAPGAFAVLRGHGLVNPNEIAGAMVNRNLSAVNVSGFVISLLALLIVVLQGRKNTPRTFVTELISLSVIATATGIGQWVIAAKLRALRVALAVPIDQIPASDPRRISFNSLHSYSVTALSIAMVAAILGIFLMMYRSSQFVGRLQ